MATKLYVVSEEYANYDDFYHERLGQYTSLTAALESVVPAIESKHQNDLSISLYTWTITCFTIKPSKVTAKTRTVYPVLKQINQYRTDIVDIQTSEWIKEKAEC